ncbi:TrbI/VirB10 family protein [Azohydromonas caseinilytica]|uniref:Conjugal transfer protein TrbI n=1 Tax=Azohydromonas caseinilytica TaxID=2728836 RepID=A0A848FCG5_9BURK|nr:TrbI/VirB10 family protein [Azohydromonas caseinilytica]NML17012.1 conjugal transfer protein TrbI [Azohydromonas caseinilytica]
MADKDLMSPDATPGKASVRRVNNVPLYLLGSALLGFVGIIGTVAYQRADQQQQRAQEMEPNTKRTTSALAMARTIAGDSNRSIIEARVDAPPPAAAPASAASGVPVARPSPEDLDRPPLPPGSTSTAAGNGAGQYTGAGTGQQQPPVDQQAQQLAQIKAQQFMEAVRANTNMPLAIKGQQPSTGAAAGAGGAPGSREEMLARMRQAEQAAASAGGESQDPMTVYRARVAALQGGPGAAGGLGDARAGAAQPVPARNGMAQFDNRQGGDRWRLDSQVEVADTPYLLRAGKAKIPVTLLEGINSELPGQITGIVTRNIFDTATGDHLLIPQGTTVVGAYSSEVAYGQARVLVGLQRLVFPDDSTLDIGGMPAADPEGYAGLHDRVNNHYVRLFASAFLLSGITAGISMSQHTTQSPNGVPTFSGAMSEAVGQQLGLATSQLLSKNMNLSPTLEIRPGFRFVVVVAKDLRFPGPYQGKPARSIQ